VQGCLPPQTVIIAGPTAVGKSLLAVEVAERLGGEIVGADAFQIYAGLDVLSAKPEPALMAQVPHHLIGEVPLDESFDVAKYLKRVRECVEAIVARGRVPVVCGGTGLYLRALTRGLAEMPSADAYLREELASQSLPELVERLRKLDPEGVSAIDLANHRRVIRALEVCLLTGKPFSSFRTQWDQSAAPVRAFVLSRPREELVQRIELRTQVMFAAGVMEEVAAVQGISATAFRMLGFREIQQCNKGEMSRDECIASIQQGTRNYAKRQMTWFRREAGWEWIDLATVKAPLEKITGVI